MPNDNRRPAQAVVEEFFVHHLPYEINMLRGLHPELSSGRNTQLIHNALVEAFHLHARNLAEFFTLKQNCSFDPRWFTEGFEVNEKFMDSDLIERINQQMSHLTARRVIGPGQLGPDDWKRIKDSIDGEVSRFEKALTSEYAARWPIRPLQINAGVGTGASSQITNLKPPQTLASDQGPQFIITGHKSASS